MASSLRGDQEFAFGAAHSEATRQTERDVGVRAAACRNRRLCTNLTFANWQASSIGGSG